MNNKFYILREYAEKSNINKEKFCFRYNIDYKEYDKYLDELVNVDKYLVFENNNYKITEKATQYLNNQKVEVAVILAAGLGQRMGSLTKDNSKCLLKINDEIIIERLITQLKNVGINNIVIIVGHVHEKFQYLASKYNVKLIFNPEYSIKNTIGSFHCAIDDIRNKNTYITVGDIYVHENLFHTFEIDPYYTAPFTYDCTNEWTYIYDENNKVYGVNVGGKYDYTVAGFSFHTRDSINKLIDLVEENYHKTGTEKYYWEDVLVNNFANLPDYYIQKLPAGVLNEFDTEKDLQQINDELLTLKEKIKEIFKVENDNFDFERTAEGLTNNSYLLKINNKKYIVRMPGLSSGLLIDRKKEYENYKLLDKYNITDKIVYFDEDTGLKITEYFENSKVIDIHSSDDLKNSMAMYKKLHSLDIDSKNDVNIVNVFEFYHSIIKKNKINFIYDDTATILKNAYKVIDFIKRFNRPQTFTHGDAGYCNILKVVDTYKLIDFEFAGMADPLTDIALFGVCGEMSIDDTLKLLDIYLDSNDKNDAGFLDIFKSNTSYEDMKSLIVSYMAIDLIACMLWNLIRITITNKYSKYNENNVKMFNKCFEYLKNRNCI